MNYMFYFLTAVLGIISACSGLNSATPDAPVANIATQEDINTGVSVELDGSGSTGATLTYTWSQTEAAPSACNVTLDTHDMSKPTFTTPDTPCSFTFSLIVSNERGDSDPATLSFNSWKDKDNRVFVDGSVATSGDGTRSAPYKTIMEGIANPSGADVYVAAVEDDNGTTITYIEDIVMAEGVSVYGGYGATDWTRNTSENISVINPATPGGLDNGTVTFSSGLTSGTSLDGFTVTGPAPAASMVAHTIYVSGDTASGTIANNILSGGVCTGDGASPMTIFCDSSAADFAISNNTITLGTATGTSSNTAAFGIYMENSCSAQITGNTLIGNSEDREFPGGVYMINLLDSSGGDISNNNIDAGTNTSAGNTLGTSGISIGTSGTVSVGSNTINGGSGVTTQTGQSTYIGSVGIFAASSSTSIIKNNIIFAGTGTTNGAAAIADNAAIVFKSTASSDVINNTIYSGTSDGSHNTASIVNLSTGDIDVVNNIMIQDFGVTATNQVTLVSANAPGLSTPYASVYNNDFNIIDGGYFYAVAGTGSISKKSESEMNAFFDTSGTAYGENISADPLFMDGSNYILSSESPCVSTGCLSSASCANVELPTTDYDGNPRSGTWSIGAYQPQ